MISSYVQLLKRGHQPNEDLVVVLSLATEELEPVFDPLIGLDGGGNGSRSWMKIINDCVERVSDQADISQNYTY